MFSGFEQERFLLPDLHRWVQIDDYPSYKHSVQIYNRVFLSRRSFGEEFSNRLHKELNCREQTLETPKLLACIHNCIDPSCCVHVHNEKQNATRLTEHLQFASKQRIALCTDSNKIPHGTLKTGGAKLDDEKEQFLCPRLREILDINNFPFYKFSLKYFGQSGKSKAADDTFMTYAAKEIWRTDVSDDNIVDGNSVASSLDVTGQTPCSYRSDSGHCINISISKQDCYIEHLETKLRSIKDVDISDLKEKYKFLFDSSYISAQRNKSSGGISCQKKRQSHCYSQDTKASKRRRFDSHTQSVPISPDCGQLEQRVYGIVQDNSSCKTINSTQVCDTNGRVLQNSPVFVGHDNGWNSQIPSSCSPVTYSNLGQQWTGNYTGNVFEHGFTSQTNGWKSHPVQSSLFSPQKTDLLQCGQGYIYNSPNCHYLSCNTTLQPGQQWQSHFASPFKTGSLSPHVHTGVPYSPYAFSPLVNDHFGHSPSTVYTASGSTGVVYDYSGFSLEDYNCGQYAAKQTTADQNNNDVICQQRPLDTGSGNEEEIDDDDWLSSDFQLLGRSPPSDDSVGDNYLYDKQLHTQTDEQRLDQRQTISESEISRPIFANYRGIVKDDDGECRRSSKQCVTASSRHLSRCGRQHDRRQKDRNRVCFDNGESCQRTRLEITRSGFKKDVGFKTGGSNDRMHRERDSSADKTRHKERRENHNFNRERRFGERKESVDFRQDIYSSKSRNGSRSRISHQGRRESVQSRSRSTSVTTGRSAHSNQHPCRTDGVSRSNYPRSDLKYKPIIISENLKKSCYPSNHRDRNPRRRHVSTNRSHRKV